MIELKKLDGLIQEVLDFLYSIQCEDGSFTTYYRHPNETKNNWVKESSQNAAIDTASSLIPLLFIDSKVATEILHKAKSFLLSSSLDRLLWRYIPASNHQHKIPFDIDSTSLSSFILRKLGLEIQNQYFLNQFINKQGYYDTYLIGKIPTFSLPFSTNLKLIFYSLNASSNHIISIEKNDFETGTTCNALLYLGKGNVNDKVWETLINDVSNQNFRTVYFSEYYSFYAFARLIKYGKHTSSHMSDLKLNGLIDYLYKGLTVQVEPLDTLFFLNALFLLEIHFEKPYLNLIEQSILEIQKGYYKTIQHYFTSHKVLTKDHLSYFGSTAVTSALYLEFLNLYRNFAFGDFYKQPLG